MSKQITGTMSQTTRFWKFIIAMDNSHFGTIYLAKAVYPKAPDLEIMVK